ncbi:MAG: response regulator transcription factor [Clostridia bacterium]|nr:response regulator transcription factor [Clostridia bacterium]
MENVLICDDEKDIVAALKIYLAAEGFNVYEAFNGRQAIETIREKDIQLVLLDIMMPEMDGITALSAIRKISNIPVILLTAKSEDCDKILGLNVGADDYITKPFNPVEVIARVRSQLRRYLQLGGSVTGEKSIRIGDIVLETEQKSVVVAGEAVSLTPIEFDILELLMKNSGKVFSPKDIYRSVWQEEPFGAENSVAVHIRHIREKNEINPAEPRYLKVVWGRGYKMEREII